MRAIPKDHNYRP